MLSGSDLVQYIGNERLMRNQSTIFLAGKILCAMRLHIRFRLVDNVARVQFDFNPYSASFANQVTLLVSGKTIGRLEQFRADGVTGDRIAAHYDLVEAQALVHFLNPTWSDEDVFRFLKRQEQRAEGIFNGQEDLILIIAAELDKRREPTD